MQRLKRRQDFVAAAKGFYQPMPAFVVQAVVRKDDEPARIGFTCTKKLGNAVIRNRIKRRLKEAARLSLEPYVKAGFGNGPGAYSAWISGYSSGSSTANGQG